MHRHRDEQQVVLFDVTYSVFLVESLPPESYLHAMATGDSRRFHTRDKISVTKSAVETRKTSITHSTHSHTIMHTRHTARTSLVFCDKPTHTSSRPGARLLALCDIEDFAKHIIMPRGRRLLILLAVHILHGTLATISIACVGDSITKAGADGSAFSKYYPSVLPRLYLAP